MLSEHSLGFWARSVRCWKISLSSSSSDFTRRGAKQRRTVPLEELALRLHEANDTHLKETMIYLGKGIGVYELRESSGNGM